MLALSQPAAGEIVYTKIHHVIRAHSEFKLDLNHDGIADYVFRDRKDGGYSGVNRFYMSEPPRNGVVNMRVHSYPCFAEALDAGVRLGPGRIWSTDCLSGTRLFQQLLDVARGSSVSYTEGYWNNVTDRYLGLRFIVQGKAHYGWARMSVLHDKRHRFVVKALVNGYAYETIPNKPIITGKTEGPDVITVDPGSLGRLAQGLAGRIGK